MDVAEWNSHLPNYRPWIQLLDHKNEELNKPKARCKYMALHRIKSPIDNLWGKMGKSHKSETGTQVLWKDEIYETGFSTHETHLISQKIYLWIS